MITFKITTQLHKIGDVVLQGGMYICVPCGYVQFFAAGELFRTCDACLAGTSDGPEGYREEAAEFWQLL